MNNNAEIALSIISLVMVSEGFSETIDPIISGTLTRCEIKSFKEFNPDDHPNRRYPLPNLLVQDIILSIKDIYYGEDIKIGSEFRYASHGMKARKDLSDLTTLGFDYDTGNKEVMKKDIELICLVIQAKNFGPPPANGIQNQFPMEHFMKCPKYSIFYVLFEPLIFETERHPGYYKVHSEWANALKRFEAVEKEDRLKELVAFVEGKNPLLAVHGVHLLARFYPQEIEPRFVPWLLSGKLTPEACLAIDQELCLKNGQEWGDSDKRETFETYLQKLNPITMEGTELVQFYRRVAPRWFSPE